MPPKPKKAPSPIKRRKLTPDYSKKAAVVLGECALAVGRGMENEMQKDPARRPYVLNDDARDHWVKFHLKSIPNAFENHGANWPKQRPGVTLMAVVLGATAAQLALKDPLNLKSAVIQVTIDHVKGATKAVQGDTRCRAAKKGGQGIYCES